MKDEDISAINLMIVDDHQLVIDGLLSLLAPYPDITVCGIANTAGALLELLAQQSTDLVLLDIDLPDMNGRELARHIHQYYPHIQMLALTMHNDRAIIKGMTQEGVKGYLLKNTSQDELALAIRRVAAGKSFYSHEVTDTLLQIPPNISEEDPNPSVLTEREQEILVLIAEGLSNNEIGEKLFISPRTVDTHRTNLMKKLGLHNVAGLVRYAFRKGLVQ
ncbi:MAG: response regulator transcription factor [Bacteroidota bacterium]